MALANQYKKEIIASSRKTGLWPSVTVGQLLYEGGNDKLSTLAKEHNNFFGMKWSNKHADRYPGAYAVTLDTKEYGSGGKYSTKSKFTHFPKAEDGITEHSIIWWNGYYPNELKILLDLEGGTMDAFIKAVGNGKYCPGNGGAYYKDLKSIIKSNNLEEWDKIAFPDGRKYAGFGETYSGTYSYPSDGWNAEDIQNMGTTTTNSDGTTNLIVKEEDLVGMYKDTTFDDEAESFDTPIFEDLTTSEKVNVVDIRESILEKNAWNMWDTLRVFTVFIGIVILVYAVFFIAGYIFDKTNTLLEVSMIGVLSLGHMHFSDEDIEKRKGYVNKSRLLKIEASLFAVGFFLVAGGLFSFIIDILYFIKG